MDVTPQELRGSEIKEAWRGYHREDVDELLERAALTIEGLSRQLSTAGSHARVEPGPVPVNRDDAEMLQRTLLLAQRAADDAVNEAQEQARKLIEESEARAQSLVGEAEVSARRIADSERRRLESEIHDLATRRDALLADTDALEVYASAYRERVRAAIEADLERLGSGAIEAPTPRPALRDVELPAPAPEPDLVAEPAPESGAETDRGGTGSETDAADTGAIVIDAPSAATPSTHEPARAPTHSPIAAPPRPAEEWPPPAPTAPGPSAAAASGTWLADDDWSPSDLALDDAPSWSHATAQPEPFASEVAMEANPIDGDALDDDAFFASLRDAVREDQPLGPRDEEPSAFFADELADDRRRFRRRR